MLNKPTAQHLARLSYRKTRNANNDSLLLQKNQQTLFIADEPELSLHIEWQRKVISSIIALNPNSQIIIATHSPEIVGRFKTSIINMENIAK